MIAIGTAKCQCPAKNRMDIIATYEGPVTLTIITCCPHNASMKVREAAFYVSGIKYVGIGYLLSEESMYHPQ